MAGEYFQLALKNLRKRGIRSWLTMLGIFIGIAAVVALISLGQGLQNAITGQFDTLDPNKLVVSSVETGFGPPGSTAVRKLTERDAEIVEDVNGVEVIIERLVRVVEVQYNDVVQYRYVANIPEDEEKIDVIYDSLNVNVAKGRLLNGRDRGKVVLGDDFSDDSFGKEIRVGSRINIQGENFEVVGILERGSSFTINSVIIMPEDDMKRVLEIGDEIDLIVVQVENKDEIRDVARNIEEKIRDDRDQDPGEEDFSVQTPEQSLQSINTILGMINIVVGGIAAISLLVGGIGIANTMYTAVLERTKEIGVMKAIGASNYEILSLFLIESALLGAVGGIVGATIGLGLAFGASFITSIFLPGIGLGVTASPVLLGGSILFALVLGIISGTLPALQASKLRPVEAFRK